MIQKKSTLVYIINSEGKILLGQKNRGLGEGFFNGFGGKNQEGETFEQCAIRELEEEAGIIANIKDLKYAGKLYFEYNGENPEIRENNVYILNIDANPTKTDEMTPYWFDFSGLPWDNMRETDRIWLPQVLDGEKVNLRIIFDENRKALHIYDESECGCPRSKEI